MKHFKNSEKNSEHLMSNNFRISEVCQIFWKRFRISEKTSENVMANFGSDWSFWYIDSHCHMNTTKKTHWFTQPAIPKNARDRLRNRVFHDALRYGSKDTICGSYALTSSHANACSAGGMSTAFPAERRRGLAAERSASGLGCRRLTPPATSEIQMAEPMVRHSAQQMAQQMVQRLDSR